MNADAATLSKVFALTRGDLESVTFPTPDISSLIAECHFVRVTRVAAFWRHPAFRNDSALAATADLLSQFQAQGIPYLSVISGEGRRVEWWVGGPRASIDRPALSSALRGALPDCRTDGDLEPRSPAIGGLEFITVVTGAPLVPARGTAHNLPEQVEKLIRGMSGHRWAFLLDARPMSAMIVVQALNGVIAEIRETNATRLLKHSPTDEQDRAAQRYVALLEAQVKRYEAGRARGMWNPRLLLLASEPQALALAQGLLHGAFSNEDELVAPIRCRPCVPGAPAPRPLEPLTTEEVAAFARPPQEEYPGYEIVDYVRYGVEAPALNPTESIAIGAVRDRGSPAGHSVSVLRNDFTKHGLVVGITGSGKTKTCMSLLHRLWDGGRGVPFLVVESAKAEYQSLRAHPDFANLEVFTVGNENATPLRLNPFEFPLGVLVQTHIDYLKSLFSAAFVLYPPMPYVLEQSLQEIYEDRGWDLARNLNLRGESPRSFPMLSDLAEKIPIVIERMGYDERITMDVKAGLLARINQLRLGGGKGLMFDVRQSTSNTRLFDRPCVLELRNLVSDDEKAFLIGLVLIRLNELCESRPERHDGQLHHVTLIEEAHRLLRNTSTEQSGEVANPRGRAIEVFANILSEIRAYGEGILIAEQVPIK